MNKTWMRWLPAALVPAVVVAGAIAIPASAGAAVALPEKSAHEVLELVATSSDATYSGTVEQRSDLGLPEIPSTGQTADAASALEFLTGSHSARVFVGDDAERLQVIDQLAERDVIRNGDDVWLYSSRAQEATHLTVPDGDRAVAGTPTTPAEIAEKLLAAVDPSTDITVGENARIAGRPAYEITVTPRSDATLVESVAMSIDAESGLPLSVVVSAVGQDAPAFSIAFSDIDFTAPDAGLFDFTPPAGATVTEQTLPQAGAPATDDRADLPRPTVTGEGWGSIVEIVAPDGAELGGVPDEAAATLEQFTTRVDGGRMVETSLLSILLTDDGRVLAGAVPADALLAAAK